MKFRPCIDLHSGKVKQIVGSTLSTEAASKEGSNSAELATNFSTDRPASEYAKMYQRDGLKGGHVIMLPSKGGQTDANKNAALAAVAAYPGGLQVGGGIRDHNAKEWIDAGASHIIVTSYVFKNGQIQWENLQKLVDIVGKDHLVLDLSCRRRPQEEAADSSANADNSPGAYYVVTDQWQKFTNVEVNAETIQKLSQYCDEFLVHGVDVEGKQCGILVDLVEMLGKHSTIPVTYAGGARSLPDMELVNKAGNGRVDLTIGSALDCFGGELKYDDVVAYHNKINASS